MLPFACEKKRQKDETLTNHPPTANMGLVRSFKLALACALALLTAVGRVSHALPVTVGPCFPFAAFSFDALVRHVPTPNIMIFVMPAITPPLPQPLSIRSVPAPFFFSESLLCN